MRDASPNPQATHTVDLIHKDESDVEWKVAVVLSADGTMCRGVTFDTLWGEQAPWDGMLTLPLESLIATARESLATRATDGLGIMVWAVGEALLACGLVEADEPDSPETLRKWVIAHPRPEDGRPPLGALLPRAPRMEKGSNAPGAAPIDDGFFMEIAAVYRLASLYGLKRQALLRHYLSSRLNPAPTQPTIDRWVRECRNRGLLPPSGRTQTAA